MSIIPGKRLIVAQSLSHKTALTLGRLPRLQRPGHRSWLVVTGRLAGATGDPWHGHIGLLVPGPTELEDLPDIGPFPVPVLLQFAITERRTFRVTNVQVPPSLRRRGLASGYLIRTHAALAAGYTWEFDPPTSEDGLAWQRAMRERLAR
jgi:hypothetical protein